MNRKKCPFCGMRLDLDKHKREMVGYQCPNCFHAGPEDSFHDDVNTPTLNSSNKDADVVDDRMEN